MPQPSFVSIPSSRGNKVNTWKPHVEGAIKLKPEVILFALPFGDAALYSYVKHMCTISSAIVSQCVDTKNFGNYKMLKPIAGNIFKQIMAKLGHILWKVDLKQQIKNPAVSSQPTMFVGVDVCHDKKQKTAFSKSKSGSSSTVGFTASFNESFTSFHSYVSFQSKGEEFVSASKKLMMEALQAFKAKKKIYPMNVIVYRDGVGNAQLDSFVRHEIKEYVEAFKYLNINPVPKLTVVIVQKRLSVRFFDTCDIWNGANKCRFSFKCNGDQQYHSPLPGSIVDSGVTSPLFSDFFLVPSVAPPGATARPTRFVVVKDECGFNSDDLQNLTNQMCYLYYGWQGPIRVPSPCMYAHKIAYLFGKHLNGDPNPAINGNLFYL